MPKEALAWATTFLTMSYIIFVNPVILGAVGMDPGVVLSPGEPGGRPFT